MALSSVQQLVVSVLYLQIEMQKRKKIFLCELTMTILEKVTSPGC